MLNKDIAIRLVRNQREGGTKLNWALLPTSNKVKDISFIRKFRETEAFKKSSFALKDDLLHKAVVSVLPGPWNASEWTDVSGYVAYIEEHNEDTAYPADAIIVDEDNNLWYSPTAISPGPFAGQAWVLYRPEMQLLTASAYMDPSSLVEKSTNVSCRLVDIEAEDFDATTNCDYYFDPDLMATLFQDVDGTVAVTEVGQEVKCIKPVGEDSAAHAIVWQSGAVGTLAKCPNGVGYITRGTDSVYNANSTGATMQLVVPGIGSLVMTGLTGQFPVTFGENTSVLMGQAAIHTTHSASTVALMAADLDRSANRYDSQTVVNLDDFFKGCTATISGIEKWHVGNVISMRSTFSAATDFTTDLSLWNVSKVATFKDCFNACPVDANVSAWTPLAALSFEGMFANTALFDQDISSWSAPLCMSTVDMFKNAQAFNQDLTGLNLTEVRNASSMFEGTVLFDSPVGGIVFTKLENVTNMFKDAAVFNQELTGLNVSTVTIFTGMFEGALLFNQSISPLNTTNGVIFTAFFKDAVAYNQPITTNVFTSAVDFFEFFYGATAFNSPVTAFASLPALTNVASMFEDAVVFNQDVTAFDTATVENFTAMFKGAEAFDKSLVGFDTSSATTMAEMFDAAITFNQDVTNFDTSGVVDMTRIFNGATAFNGDVTTWDVSAVTTFDLAFHDAVAFNQDISGWNVSAAVTMAEMFHGATVFAQDLLRWCVPGVTSAPADFGTDAALTGVPLWGRCPTGSIASTAMLASYDPAVMTSLFKDAALTDPVTAIGDEVKGITDLSGLNNHLVSSGMTHPTYQEDTSGRGYLSLPAGASLAATGITSAIEIQAVIPAVGVVEVAHTAGVATYWGKTSATTLGAMAFTVVGDATNLDGADASVYAAGTTTSIAGMFEGEETFDTELDTWDTSAVTDMTNLFKGATVYDQPLTNWDLSGVVSLTGMFEDAAAFDQDLSGLTFSTGITSTANMFKGATAFNQDLSGLTTAVVTDMTSMFEDAVAFNSPFSAVATGFDHVVSFDNMFKGAAAYNQDISLMVVAGGASMDGMFHGAAAFDQDLSAWCVSGKAAEPQDFMTDADANFIATTAKHPAWGQAC